MCNINHFDRPVRLRPERAVSIVDGLTLSYGELHHLTDHAAGPFAMAGIAMRAKFRKGHDRSIG